LPICGLFSPAGYKISKLLRADKYPENQLVIPACYKNSPLRNHLIVWKNIPELLFFNENNLKFLLVFRSSLTGCQYSLAD